METETRSTSNKLECRWLPPAKAYDLAAYGHVSMRRMFNGMNTISYEQYKERLNNGHLEVLLFSNGAAFLVTWGESNRKKLCQIMTLTGVFDDTADDVLDAFEKAVYERGGRVILSFGRRGYAPIMKRHDYTIDPCILMRKELQDDTGTKN